MWEPERFEVARKRWWNVVLEADWVVDQDILETCGPEYLMYEDMHQFGAESAYRGFPRKRA